MHICTSNFLSSKGFRGLLSGIQGFMLRALGILRWSAMGLLGTGVIYGTFLALDRYDADAKSRDTMHLLDFLDESPLSEGTSKTRNRSLKAIRPPSELALSIRVGLLSRSPIQSLRTSPTTTCRLANGSFIAVDQLLVVNVDSSGSTSTAKVESWTSMATPMKDRLS